MTHPWPVFTPEANYTAITTGAGPAPMLAYGDVLLAHGASMVAVAGASVGTATGTFASWQGVGAGSAELANVGLNTQTLALADMAMAKAAIAHQAAAVHSATVARMVTHVQATANRTHEAVDEAINPWVLGALTPEIAALNLEYFGYMWPNNAAAGVGYGVALDGFGAALMTPLPPAISGASPAAAASAAAAVAETAAVNGVGAAIRAAEQAATAVVSPVVAAPAAAAGLLGGVPLAGPASAATAAQPMAAVQAPPTAAVSTAVAPAPVMGMFAQPLAAAVVAPPAPTAGLEDSPVAQTSTPRTGPISGPVAGPAPAPSGVTSFVPPAQSFAPPPPTTGRAAGLRPGMLNATAVRGPVTTMPLTTTTSTLATAAAQPLAYVPPEPPPRPSASRQPQFSDPGQALHAQPPKAPPPTPPPQTPLSAPPAPSTPASAPSPPATPVAGLPAPSAQGSAPGAGASGTQMLGGPYGPIPLGPTTTTTSPTPTPPIPKCDPQEEIPKLSKELAEVNQKIENQKKKLKDIEKLPLNDPKRLEYNQESDRINWELLGIMNSALECGYKVVFTPDNGFQVVPASPGK